MKRLCAPLGVALLLLFGSAEGKAAEPQSLEECYMQVAMQKSTADLVYLARDICDAVFRRFPRPLTVLDPRKQECSEWWFDARGRYETADRYCALEADGAKSWKLACQWKKGTPRAYSFARLREVDGRYELVGKALGKPVGELFTGIAACVEKRAESVAGAG